MVLDQLAAKPPDLFEGGEAERIEDRLIRFIDNHDGVGCRLEGVVDSRKSGSLSCPVIRLEKNGMRWEVASGFESLLGLVLESLQTEVKRSPAKTVVRCAWEGRTYYIKTYRHRVHPLRPFKYYLKTSPARREWRLAAALEERGIPVVRHLALGERWGLSGLQESVLITEGFAGKPVRADSPGEAKAVVAFVRRMHDVGVLQQDLHGANLLRHPDSGEIRMVDLYGTELHDTLSPQQRRHNLAVLRMTLPIPVDHELERQSRELRRKALHHRSKRAWKHNRDFEPCHFGGLHWQVRRQDNHDVVRDILRDPDGFLEQGRILKAGRSSTVGAASGFVLKRHNFKKPLNLVKDLFRPSRAMRALRLAHHLELVGIATASPVAAGELRRAGVVLRSYFLMHELKGAVPLEASTRSQGGLVAAVARLVGRLHDEGFTHRDLKVSNLMVDPDGKVHLIDLEGLRFVGEISSARAHADLGRLQRSALDLARLRPGWRRQFLQAYCQVRRIRGRAAAQFLRGA